MLNMSWRNSEQTIANFKARGPQIIAALSGKIDMLMFELANLVQTKLSGQVLNVRSGKLRASVHALETKILGTKIVGTVEQAPEIAFYGRLQEEGTSRFYEILSGQKRALSFVLGGKERAFARVTHGPIKARAFMRTSEEESAAHIYSELQKAVSDVTKE